MINMTNIDQVRGLKSNLHATFDTAQGKESMKFMQEIGGWFPSVFDSMDTNAIIARDANRRLLGTVRTILDLTPEQIVALAQKEA
jgi:hypothetical protein